MRSVSVVILLLVSGSLFAENIAVVDSDRIFDIYGDVADARELLELEIEEWQAHVDSLQDEIDVIGEDLSHTLMMSPERRREQESRLDQKKTELETYVSSTFGPGGILERRNEELVAPIVASINEAVREISIEENYDLVLDAAAGTVVYAAPAVDITDQVLERLSVIGTH